jgi:hypothetical protein
MNLYAYCLCQEMDENALETVTGLAGVKPFVMPYDRIVAVVSEVDGSPITVTRENALSHAKVISHVFAQTTPLPFRFGALLRQAELDRYVESNRQSLLAMLARVRGTAEMSVKIIAEGRSVGGAAQGHEEPAEAEEGIGRGAMFLAAKQRELEESRMSEERAREIANWLAEHLVGVVNDSFVRLRPTGGLAVKAAHLVERRRLEAYRERLKRARGLRPELLFLTSGPWPPYSFCDLTT